MIRPRTGGPDPLQGGQRIEPDDYTQGLSTPDRPGPWFWAFWVAVGSVWVVGITFAVCGFMAFWRSL